MDIRELRIGNWVNYQQTKTRFQPACVAEVYRYYRYSVYIELNNPLGLDNHFVVSGLELITPIPITPETLNLIGEWQCAFGELHNLVTNEGVTRVCVWQHKKGHHILETHENRFEVRSIHQIQNILASVYEFYI